MLTTLAAIDGQAIIWAVLTLIVLGACYWLLDWAVDKLVTKEPFHTVLKFILILGAVIVCINALLSLIGKQFIRW